MQETITRKEFLGLLDDLFEFDRGSLKGGDGLADRGWDSLKFLEFVTLVDTQFDLRVSPRDVVACKTVDDLVALVKDRIDE